MKNLVLCNHCGWHGEEEKLKVVDDIEMCPVCEQVDALMDDEISL